MDPNSWKPFVPGQPSEPPRHEGYTPASGKAKKDFLEFLEESGLVEEAASQIDVSTKTVYRWRVQDPAFAAEWDEIIRNKVLPRLEAEAIKRAIGGSDLMLIFLMKAYKRDMYDDKIAAANILAKGGKKRTRIIIEDVTDGHVVADIEEDEDGETRVERRDGD